MIMMWRRSGEVIAQSSVAAYALPAHSILNQRAKHDVNIHVSFFRMPKCAGQSADNFETKLIPKMDRSGVRGDHEIELHGAKAHSARLRQTVLGHSASHSSAFGISCHHESGIGDMRPGTRLVRPQNISACNAPILLARCRGRRCRPKEAIGFPYRLSIKFCDIGVSIGSKPISQRFLARHLRIKRVCIACSDDLMENIPDRVVVRFSCRADFHCCN